MAADVVIRFLLGRADEQLLGWVALHQLNQAIRTIAKHLHPGGMTIIEPWFGPGDLDVDKVHATFVDEPELKIARMNINRVEGNMSYLDFHYMVAMPGGRASSALRKRMPLGFSLMQNICKPSKMQGWKLFTIMKDWTVADFISARNKGYLMTPTQFKSRIRQSISDEALQIALDNNAQRRCPGTHHCLRLPARLAGAPRACTRHARRGHHSSRSIPRAIHRQGGREWHHRSPRL